METIFSSNNKNVKKRIQSRPGRRISPLTTSAKMHPTLQMSTAKKKQKKKVQYKDN